MRHGHEDIGNGGRAASAGYSSLEFRFTLPFVKNSASRLPVTRPIDSAEEERLTYAGVRSALLQYYVLHELLGVSIADAALRVCRRRGGPIRHPLSNWCYSLQRAVCLQCAIGPTEMTRN